MRFKCVMTANTTNRLNLPLSKKIGAYWLAHWPTLVLIIVHCVGVVGLSVDLLRPWFLLLTPVNLLLTLAIMLYVGRPLTKGQIIALIVVGLAGYFVEVIGVNTGLIFGTYWYLTALGPKLLETPLMIGINWVILTYAALSLVSRLKINQYAQTLIAALIMVGLDMVIEPVAMKLDFWDWPEHHVPFQNYVGWFVTSCILLQFMQWVHVEWTNRLAGTVLLVELFFFTVLLFGFSF